MSEYQLLKLQSLPATIFIKVVQNILSKRFALTSLTCFNRILPNYFNVTDFEINIHTSTSALFCKLCFNAVYDAINNTPILRLCSTNDVSYYVIKLYFHYSCISVFTLGRPIFQLCFLGLLVQLLC